MVSKVQETEMSSSQDTIILYQSEDGQATVDGYSLTESSTDGGAFPAQQEYGI